MGEILTLTHSPLMCGLDENLASFARAALADPGLPEACRDPANWPAAFRRELAEDGGLAAARAHRAQVVAGFRRARNILDDFAPDVIVIWDDDQYENFKEDEEGAAAARTLRESPWRVALVASSSWSHSFLTPKHSYLYPDVEADRRLYEALRLGDYEAWRQISLAELEDAGQQEVLNWYCLVGAMEALGRKPDECEYAETWAFVAGKCFAVWRP